MSFDHMDAVPQGQHKVLESWRKRLRGRKFITCAEIDIPAINRELAYVSVLSCEEGQFRFRLAGTGLQHVFGGEARGKTADEIEACRGGAMWAELATRAMLRAMPVSGDEQAARWFDALLAAPAAVVGRRRGGHGAVPRPLPAAGSAGRSGPGGDAGRPVAAPGSGAFVPA